MDEAVICTLVALCILEEMFIDNEDEWKMIANKARAFLQKSGVNITEECEKLVTLLFWLILCTNN